MNPKNVRVLDCWKSFVNDNYGMFKHFVTACAVYGNTTGKPFYCEYAVVRKIGLYQSILSEYYLPLLRVKGVFFVIYCVINIYNLLL